ncbi:zinc metalloproteinase nas-15 isoform X1 [Hydra vulgaris]|uniref:zinc metalloproteinase nas-15 isoform X1 n=1 Tax=Hydra vulgaris TaxID=6087 RepID=UPI000192607F|nr:zinc metalloproteinase nas-15 [Hydra vulgaris]
MRFLSFLLCVCFVLYKPSFSKSILRYRRDTVRNPSRKWPGGTVPFLYSANTSYQTKMAFEEAVREIQKVSCVRFVPRTHEKDYVRVITGAGCYSMIGKDGGEQELSLGQGCYRKGISLHEIMHLLGFFHEQSRPDRDDHVTIHSSHISEDARTQFRKYRYEDGDTLGEDYDPDSIMHYENNAFSKNGQSTITHKKYPWKSFGQREKLSDIDKIQLNKLYRCKKTNDSNDIDKKINENSKITSNTDKVVCADNQWSSLNGECIIGYFMGRCNSSPVRMSMLCPKTCGFCSPTCKDNSPFCSSLSGFVFCESNYAKNRCKKSCGFC